MHLKDDAASAVKYDRARRCPSPSSRDVSSGQPRSCCWRVRSPRPRALTPEEWHPLALVALLLVLALVGEWFTVETQRGMLSASADRQVLAMGLLGTGSGRGVWHRRDGAASRPGASLAGSMAEQPRTFAVVPFAEGWWCARWRRRRRSSTASTWRRASSSGSSSSGRVHGHLALNFVLFALDIRVEEGRSLARQVRELFLPLLPGELAAGADRGDPRRRVHELGLPVLFAAVPVLLIFQYLTVALLRSEDRAEQLEARSIQLVRCSWAC